MQDTDWLSRRRDSAQASDASKILLRLRGFVGQAEPPLRKKLKTVMFPFSQPGELEPSFERNF